MQHCDTLLMLDAYEKITFLKNVTFQTALLKSSLRNGYVVTEGQRETANMSP